MAPKHVRGSDHKEIISLLDSVLESDSDFDEILEEDNFLESDVRESNMSSSESDDGTLDSVGPTQQKRVRKEKSDWIWRNTENHPTVHNFSADNGVCKQLFTKYAANPVSELLLFLDFMSPLFAAISQETNDYAQKQLSNQKRKDDDLWFDTTEDEIKAYFSMCILMSQVRKRRIQLYWSKDRCIETPIFSELMSRERFLLSCRFLHFTDDTVASNESEKLKKLRPIIIHFLEKFSELYNLSENIALDESLMKFRGRYVQCNRSKRARFGIKIYKVCDSNTGTVTVSKYIQGKI
jgi:hypothetical protein